MKRTQLEHIVRAAANAAADRGILVIGSHSVLGTFPEKTRLIVQNAHVGYWCNAKVGCEEA